jgi:Fe-S-cluster containining protein
MLHRKREEIPGQNPCLSCGACCVGLRASFYWAEADDAAEGGVPARLTVRVGAFRRAMRQGQKGRCVALRGTPGRKVACGIYEHRPSVCRNFQPAWAGGPLAGDRCLEARARLELPPFRHAAENPLTGRPLLQE